MQLLKYAVSTPSRIINNVATVVLVCLFLCINPVSAQNNVNTASQFLTRLSPNEGLSQSSVTKIAQDKDGFIWVATELGLNRYDGYKITQINKLDGVFEKESISTLFIDEQDYLWVSTEVSGLYRVNTSTFETEQFFSGKITPEDKSYSEVHTIKQGENNTLWLGISNQVYQLNITTRQLTNYLTLETKDDIIRDLYLDSETLYCATSDGVYKININSGYTEVVPHRPVISRSVDSENTKLLVQDPLLGLLVGTVDGLFQLSAQDGDASQIGKPRLLIPDLNIWDMLSVKGKYYVATNKGLYWFDPKTKLLDFVLNFSDSSYRTADDNISDIYKDKTGNIWLASRSQGVMKWSPLTLRFSHITAVDEPKLSHENVWALHQDKNNILWVGTDNGINKLELGINKNTTFLTNPDLKAVTGNQVIRSIFANPDDDNLLWVVNDNGFFNFNKTTGLLETPYLNEAAKLRIKDKWLNGFFVIDNRNIVFFNQDGHLLYDSMKGTITSLTALDDFNDVDLSWSFLKTLPGKENSVVLATSGHLYLYDLTTKAISLIYKVKNYQQQSFDYVDNFVIDKNNVLWIAMSGEGLVGLDYDTLEEKYRYDTTNQLTSNSVYSLQLDEHDNLWFSSQSGLFRLNLDTHYIENFTASDGLIADEFNSSSYTLLDDKRLAFGSPLGVTLLSPEKFLQDSNGDNNFHVTLTGLSLMSNDSQAFNDLNNLNFVELEHDDYGLKLQFSTLQFIKQAKTKYNIELAGPSPLNLANYDANELILPKLPAGDYQLKVTATHPQSGQQSSPLLLDIHSKYAPWASPQAKVGVVVVCLLIFALYMYRRKIQNDELIDAHRKTQASKDQMQLALQGSNSGIWDYRIEEDHLYEERLTTELGYSKLAMPVSIKQHIGLIDPAQYFNLKPKWLDFVAGNSESWDITYQMKSSQGEWYWYRDVGRIIARNSQGIPSRVSGTYTNITDTKVNEAQAILFGEAFSQINDWVLILDLSKQPVTANEAFIKAFGLSGTEPIPPINKLLSKLGEQKYQEFKEIIESIVPGDSWQGEEVIETVSSPQHPVLIKINAIAKHDNIITHYVIVISDITNQKLAEDKLRYLADYDYLTNLPNRKLILEKIEAMIQESKGICALFFIDLDKFKQVNDTFGHLMGDKLLKHVAKTLIDNVKHRDIVARQSGDEFMILIDSFDSVDNLSHIAERINECLSKPIDLDGNHIHVTSSIGIAISPHDSTSASGLIKKADLAMIHAKQTGRGQFQFFTKDMNEKAHRRLMLERELKKACGTKNLVNYYQPIVDHRQQNVIGFELLLRWFYNDNIIMPSTFIPIAEECGLIFKITVDAIDQALKDFRTWQSKFPNSYISVNLSAVHIVRGGINQTLIKLLEKHQLPTSVLRLEITEGTLLADLDIALIRLDELRKSGFKLLLDDFGTGYSSLTYLSRFPVHVLKIDKSFILDLDTNPMNKPIIKSIISLAKNLNLSCIAEGVETKEQLEYLHSLGCDAIQGFYFAKPMPVDNIGKLGCEIFSDVLLSSNLPSSSHHD